MNEGNWKKLSIFTCYNQKPNRSISIYEESINVIILFILPSSNVSGQIILIRSSIIEKNLELEKL